MFDGSFALLMRVFKYLPFSAAESTDARLDFQLGGGSATVAALISNASSIQVQAGAPDAVLAFNKLVRAAVEASTTTNMVAADDTQAITEISRPIAVRLLASQIAYQARMNTPVGRKPRTSAALPNRPVDLKVVKKATKAQPVRAKTVILIHSASIHALPTAAQIRKDKLDHGLRLVA